MATNPRIKGALCGIALAAITLLVGLTGGGRSTWLPLYVPLLFASGWWGGAWCGLYTTAASFLLFTSGAYYFGPSLSQAKLQSALQIFALSGLAGAMGSTRWLGVAMARRRQVESLQWQEKLADLIRQICFCPDLLTAVDLIIINIDIVVDAPACAVLLYDQLRGELRPESVSGLPESFSTGAVLAVARNEIGRLLAEGSSVCCVDTSQPDTGPVFPQDSSARSYVLVPLVCLEGVVGAIYLSWPQAGMPVDGVLTQLEELAGSISYALQRLKNEKEFEHLALTDGLTGLYNYRMLRARLVEEAGRAARHNTPLSFFMIDLDYFKDVNDQHGHPMGDQVLRALAQGVRQYCRSGDIPARYGGEEFAILCPGLILDKASAAAERFRRGIEEAIVEVTGIRLTLSIGIANFPETTLDPD
nr:sensor domain-containing diguanylate cyclase [Armatimonadota bacterium]